MLPCPKLLNPIVIVPGLFGFDYFSFYRQNHKGYFPGISNYFKLAGNQIYFANLHPTRGIKDRAAQLKEIIRERFTNQQVHIVGHSLGGLDSRYLISKLNMASQVLSLTTIGTPHRGSAFADWGVPRVGRILIPLLKYFQIDYGAFEDLTTLACKRFNEDVLDAPGVHYLSIAGRCDGPILGPEWRLPASIVRAQEGDNDGVVSVRSAQYGTWNEVWEGDHLNLINWPNRHVRKLGKHHDRISDYGRILQQIHTLCY